MTSSRGIARMFSSSSMIVSGSADGRSILLRTGMSVRFSRRARWTLASVWASMPWVGVDDEDRALAGLEAVADLVGEVDVAGRVDEVEPVGQPVAGRVLEARRRAP